MGVGAVIGRRALVLLVAAIMALMMSMGPAMAFGGGSVTLGGQGGGPNGGDGGSVFVAKNNFKKHKCWYKRHGQWHWYWCYR